MKKLRRQNDKKRKEKKTVDGGKERVAGTFFFLKQKCSGHKCTYLETSSWALF